MSNLLTIWEFIGKHKYLITVLAFAAIIGFLDENSAIRRIGYTPARTLPSTSARASFTMAGRRT